MKNLREAIQDPETAVGFSARIASLWGVIGITSWTDFAAFLAALYSLILIGEWLWKRFIRPFLERRGIIYRKRRRSSDWS